MTRRNVAWLVAIAVVGVAVGIAARWWVGVLAAVITIVVSELVERRRRARIRRDRGPDAPRTGLRDVVNSRRRR